MRLRTGRFDKRLSLELDDRRRGTVLVITAVVLTALIGLLGIVVDAGQLMTAHRQTQNAADAAATAAAMDLMSGKSNGTAIATATTFVQQHNGMPTGTVTVNIPPVSGPHLGQAHYIETIVSLPVATYFIRALGVANSKTVTARAVSGFEPVTSGEGVVALDPTARPGLSIGGNGQLKVNGGVIVNSEGGGVDQNGSPINNGNTGFAATTANNSILKAVNMQVVGGVNTPANFQNYDSNSSINPLHTGAMIQPDPLLNLPTPTTANGAVSTSRGSVSVNGNQVVTLLPGVYSQIRITGGTVTFSPGIYVLTGGNTNTLKISGGNVTGTGVMFYNTGDNFNVATGLPDSGDGSTVPSPSNTGSATFGGIDISTSINLTGLNSPGSVFDGMLIYQRRFNTAAAKITGNAGAGQLGGTIYSKWGQLSITGQGTYNAQFIVGWMDVTGNGNVTINYAGQNLGKGYQVFLVE